METSLNSNRLIRISIPFFCLLIFILTGVFLPNVAQRNVAAQACSFPMNAATEAELNAAIACYNTAGAGDYEINITADIALLTNTLPISNSSTGLLTINGDGQTIDGNNQARIFNVQSGDVAISKITVLNGSADSILCLFHTVESRICGGGLFIGSTANVTLTSSTVLSSTAVQGGGLFNQGSLNVVGSTFSGNSATAYGGGLFNSGSLVITNSQLTGNKALLQGGGIDTTRSGVTTIISSVFRENTADRVAGAAANDGRLSISQSTFSQNSANTGGALSNNYPGILSVEESALFNNAAAQAGGALFNDSGKATFINSTISANSAKSGSAMFVVDSTTKIINSTLAENKNTEPSDAAIFLPFGSIFLSNSIVANSIDGSNCSGGVVSDSQSLDTDGSCGSSTQVTETALKLGPLQNNGGSTLTHALLAGSVALDAAASDPAITADQRGVPRPQGIKPDIGSFEAVPSISNVQVSDAQLAETDSGTASLVFTISRSNNSSASLVTVNTADGTAAANSDYTPIAGETVTFPAGGSLTQLVTIPIVGDKIVEADETFSLILKNPINASITDNTGIGTITNDDTATLQLHGGTSRPETDSGQVPYVFTATLSSEVQGGFSIDMASKDITATVVDNDYQAISDTLNFAGNAGEEHTFTILVNGDTTVEADESFGAEIVSGPDTSLADDILITTEVGRFDLLYHTAQIFNDDSAVVTISGPSEIIEGDSGSTTLTFEAELDNGVDGGFSLAYATQNGTAESPNDFEPVSGTWDFAGTSGEKKMVTIDVYGDIELEANETFQINIGDFFSTMLQANLSKSGAPHAITIVDDEPVGPPKITLISADATENDGVVELTVSLDKTISETVSVDFKTSNETARAGIDYTAVDQTVTFTPGTATQTVAVQLIDDTIYEREESFSVSLSNASNGFLATTSAVEIKIIDDDAAPTVRVGDVTVAEPASGETDLVFEISLSTFAAVDISLNFATVDVTAAAGADYTATSGKLVISAGSRSGKIKVKVNSDNLDEETEQLKLVFTNLSDGTLAGVDDNDSVTGSIENTTPEPPSSGRKMLFLPIMVR